MTAGFVCYSAAASGTGHCPARKLRWGLGEQSALPTGSKWVQAQPILPRLSQSRRATNVRKKSLFSS